MKKKKACTAFSKPMFILKKKSKGQGGTLRLKGQAEDGIFCEKLPEKTLGEIHLLALSSTEQDKYDWSGCATY